MIPALQEPSPLAYYVYYRLRADTDSAEAEGRIAAMQQTLAASTGVHGRLLRRKDDPATWMEIYEPIEDGPVFELALQQAVDSAGIAGLIEPGSARHLERFIDMEPASGQHCPPV